MSWYNVIGHNSSYYLKIYGKPNFLVNSIIMNFNNGHFKSSVIYRELWFYFDAFKEVNLQKWLVFKEIHGKSSEKVQVSDNFEIINLTG